MAQDFDTRHGENLGMDGGTSPGEADGREDGMRTLRRDEESRRAPRGSELPEQLTRELDRALSLLSSQGAPLAGVRRLTPREAERLMGWPDDHTRWTADGREISDSHRYRMAGNGVASPVAEWIGHRLVAVDRMQPR